MTEQIQNIWACTREAKKVSHSLDECQGGTLDCVCARAAYALTNAATWATMSTKMMIFSAGSTPDRCRLETLLICRVPSTSRSRVTTQRNLQVSSSLKFKFK